MVFFLVFAFPCQHGTECRKGDGDDRDADDRAGGRKRTFIIGTSRLAGFFMVLLATDADLRHDVLIYSPIV